MFNGGGKIKAGSQQLIKETNIRRIFKLVSEKNGVSRAELANITGLSPTTVSSLIEELMETGLVKETGTADLPTSGRKPIILKVDGQGGCIVSADLHEYGYNLAIFNLDCSILSEVSVDLPDYRALGSSLVSNISQILKNNKFEDEKLMGICIGAPGIIDRKNKKILSSTIIPIEEGNDFITVLEKSYGDTEIELVNESSLSAYAEKEYGEVAKDSNNLVYIDIHTGIGAGIIINGRMYEGSGSLAGEFGHMSVDLNGPLCKCGSRGCLETLAGIHALIADVEGDSGFPEEYPMAGTVNEKFTLIAREYREKGDFSLEINQMARYIAYGINNTVNLLNPDVVVIGGQAAALGEKFLAEVRRILDFIGLSDNRRTKVILSDVKDNPVTTGGARHIFNLLF